MLRRLFYFHSMTPKEEVENLKRGIDAIMKFFVRAQIISKYNYNGWSEIAMAMMWMRLQQNLFAIQKIVEGDLKRHDCQLNNFPIAILLRTVMHDYLHCLLFKHLRAKLNHQDFELQLCNFLRDQVGRTKGDYSLLKGSDDDVDRFIDKLMTELEKDKIIKKLGIGGSWEFGSMKKILNELTQVKTGSDADITRSAFSRYASYSKVDHLGIVSFKIYDALNAIEFTLALGDITNYVRIILFEFLSNITCNYSFIWNDYEQLIKELNEIPVSIR